MHTFEQKPKATQTTPAKSPSLRRGVFGQDPRLGADLHLRRTNANQAAQRVLQTNTEDSAVELTGLTSPRFDYDVGRVPLHPPAAGGMQAKLAINGPDPLTRGMMQPRLGHDFSQFQQFFDGKPEGGKTKPESEKPQSREPCDKECGTSGRTYGNTECEIDVKSGLLTGKVTKEVLDKNACTQPCVEAHEDIHAKNIAPVCTAIKKCLDAAGGDVKKEDKCLDKFQADMNALTFSTECAAYTAEEECLSKRAKKTECKSTDGKQRWVEQMKMVKCYKGCFCKK